MALCKMYLLSYAKPFTSLTAMLVCFVFLVFLFDRHETF